MVIISGCGGHIAKVDYDHDGQPAYGDIIVEGSIGDATTLIPIVASDSSSHAICALLYNGLVKYDKDLNIIGDLAENWDIQDDGLVIVFHLRRDVKWHDGAAFTADDVRFTYERLVDPKVRTPYSGDFQKIASLEVTDRYTVRVTYKEPFAPALSSWGMHILPRHILHDQDLNSTQYARDPVGTGPYRFLRWISGQRIDLVANQDYFEGPPYIKGYIYRIIPDTDTMFLEIQTESIDIMDLSPVQYQRQTGNRFFSTHYNKYRYPTFGYSYLGYNLLDDKFRDIRVRKALNLAVDKQELIEGVLMGLGRVCTGPFVPESWAYNSDIKPDAYDPQLARSMLNDAGWQDNDADGWLDKDGSRFEFTILTNQGNDMRRRAAEIIQRRLAQIGIKVKIKIVEWSVFLTEFINKKRFEAVLLGWNISRDPDCYDIWHSSKTREGEFNFAHYKNEEVDRLLQQARRTFDQDERRLLYNRIHTILYDEQPYMFLWVADNLPIIHKRFKGISPAPAGIGYNFIRWYVPAKQQRYKR